MKHFLTTHRHRLLQGLPSAFSISFCAYLFLRIIFHDFPMSWPEEIGFLFRVMFVGSVLIVLATGSCAGMHAMYKRIRRRQQTA